MSEHVPQTGHMAEVALQVDQVTVITPTEATAIVRCVRGPAHRGARFDRVQAPAASIDLELAGIVLHGRFPVEELDPAHTALVTLRGTGVHHIITAAAGSRWPIIRGTNPSLL